MEKTGDVLFNLSCGKIEKIYWKWMSMNVMESGSCRSSSIWTISLISIYNAQIFTECFYWWNFVADVVFGFSMFSTMSRKYLVALSVVVRYSFMYAPHHLFRLAVFHLKKGRTKGKKLYPEAVMVFLIESRSSNSSLRYGWTLTLWIINYPNPVKLLCNPTKFAQPSTYFMLVQFQLSNIV